MSSEDSELPKKDLSFARVFRGVSYCLQVALDSSYEEELASLLGELATTFGLDFVNDESDLRNAVEC